VVTFIFIWCQVSSRCCVTKIISIGWFLMELFIKKQKWGRVFETHGNSGKMFLKIHNEWLDQVVIMLISFFLVFFTHDDIALGDIQWR